MGDQAEIWAGMRAAKKERQRTRYQTSIEKLDKAGVTYQTFNKGNMLRIVVDKGTVDFWPSTGLWIVRNTQPEFRGCGVGSLILWLQKG